MCTPTGPAGTFTAGARGGGRGGAPRGGGSPAPGGRQAWRRRKLPGGRNTRDLGEHRIEGLSNGAIGADEIGLPTEFLIAHPAVVQCLGDLRPKVIAELLLDVGLVVPGQRQLGLR